MYIHKTKTPEFKRMFLEGNKTQPMHAGGFGLHWGKKRTCCWSQVWEGGGGSHGSPDEAEPRPHLCLSWICGESESRVISVTDSRPMFCHPYRTKTPWNNICPFKCTQASDTWEQNPFTLGVLRKNSDTDGRSFTETAIKAEQTQPAPLIGIEIL